MISSPEDYGLSEQQTLAFTYDEPAPSSFDTFWAQWREAHCHIPARVMGNTDSQSGAIVYESARNVSIVARLTRPAGIVRGAVVTSHGYDVDEGIPEEEESWTARGLATLRVRVRGFPPSTAETGDLRSQWILHNIHDAQAWILGGAVADIVQSVKVIQKIFARQLPVALHGESFGGGLAVLAAAQLEQLGTPVDRLILGLPTFGAWRWRLHKYCNGTGGQINMMVEALRGDDQVRLLNVLDLFDAVHHARRIHCPVLCKLACRDDVVPAPTAASVFNALGSEDTWAFVTKYGHFDGGLADARRHVAFERLHPGFADTQVPAAETIAVINSGDFQTAPKSPNLL